MLNFCNQRIVHCIMNKKVCSLVLQMISLWLCAMLGKWGKAYNLWKDKIVLFLQSSCRQPSPALHNCATVSAVLSLGWGRRKGLWCSDIPSWVWKDRHILKEITWVTQQHIQCHVAKREVQWSTNEWIQPVCVIMLHKPVLLNLWTNEKQSYAWQVF